MEIDRLNRGERIAGAAAALLFVDMFLSWYSANINGAVAAAARRFGVDTSVDAWQAFSMTDVLLLITVIVTLAMVGVRALGRDVSLPVSLPLVAAALGALMTLLVLYRIINQPGPNDFINVEYGAYLGLLLVAALTYGAVQAGGGIDSMRAEAESLQTRATATGASTGPVSAASVAEPPRPPATAANPTPPAGHEPAETATDPAPPPQPPSPQPTPPGPDPTPSPAPEPAPPQPGDDPAGPTA